MRISYIPENQSFKFMFNMFTLKQQLHWLLLKCIGLFVSEQEPFEIIPYIWEFKSKLPDSYFPLQYNITVYT